MPNHVTNILTLKGSQEDIEKCFESIKNSYKKRRKVIDTDFDFNKIIPMPPSLQITSGTETDQAVAILKNNVEYFQRMLSYPWVKNENISDIESLRKYLLLKISKKGLLEGLQAIKNEEEHGYPDWYSWSCAKWGTKWNAYDIKKIANDSIRFDTAWSTPFPVMLKLSELFPSLTVEVYYADEDIGSNCGSYFLKAGTLINEYSPEGNEAIKFAHKIQSIDDDETEMGYVVNCFMDFSPNELLDIKEDLIKVMNKCNFEKQKEFIDFLLNKTGKYYEYVPEKEKVKFLLDTFVESEFFEAADYLTKQTEVKQEEI